MTDTIESTKKYKHDKYLGQSVAERRKIDERKNAKRLRGSNQYDKIEPLQSAILTVQEVADILRVHRSTITRYALSGQLRSHLIGNRRLFKDSDVWEFFDNQVDRVCDIGKGA